MCLKLMRCLIFAFPIATNELSPNAQLCHSSSSPEFYFAPQCVRLSRRADLRAPFRESTLCLSLMFLTSQLEPLAHHRSHSMMCSKQFADHPSHDVANFFGPHTSIIADECGTIMRPSVR